MPKLVPSAKLTDVAWAAPREAFGETVLELAKNDPRLVALCADLTESIRLDGFAKAYPDRFFEVGVAEQNLMSMAAGLALSGKIPFACSFAVFNPGRNWDQLRVSVCYAQANVKIIGAHAGLSVGEDGATHQALEDIAMTRVLPGLVVLAPTDALETKKVVQAAIEYEGPVYIRFGRAKVATVTTTETPFTIGKANLLRDGSEITLCASGSLVYEALLAAEELQHQGIAAAVLAVPSIKPLDTELLLSMAKQTGGFVTAEDAQIAGGLGSAIAEFLSEVYPIPIKRIGMKDSFGTSGKADDLMKLYGLTSEAIVAAAHEVISMKKAHVY